MFVAGAIFLITAFLAGCATSGRQFDTTRINDIKNGVHTKADIQAWFGEPFSKVALTNNPTCVERWTYAYAKAVGFGTIKESHSLVVDFSADGKVCVSAYFKQK